MLNSHKQEDPILESEISIDSGTTMLADLLGMFRRQSRLIGVAFVLGLAGGAVFIAVAPKKYTATASVFVDFLHPTTLSTTQMISLTNGVIDPAAVESQIDILQSEHIAKLAIDRLGLLKNPDLVIYRNPLLSQLTNLAVRIGLISPPTNYEIERSVVDAVMKNTSVVRAGKNQQTFVIEVSYDAQDPAIAARAANAIVGNYLTDQLRARFDMAKLANDWFDDRLREIHGSVVAAERAAQKFRADNNIITVTGNPLDEQNLSQSDQNLVTARVALADARARRDRLNQIIATGEVQAVVPDALSSAQIQGLRTKYAELMQHEGELRFRVGPGHESLAQVRAEIAQTQTLIKDEFDRIRRSTENEVKIDEARIAEMEQHEVNAVTSSTLIKEKMVQAAELDREARAVRALYESFMGRFQQTLQEQSYPVSDARMITEAQPPTKQSRHTGLILALGSVAGFFLGAGAAWLRENMDRRIRTGMELEIATGARFLGNLPIICPAEMKTFSREVQVQGHSRVNRKMLETPSFLQWKGLVQFSLVRALGFAFSSEEKANGQKRIAESPPPACLENQFHAVDSILRYAVTEPLSPFAETMRSCKISLRQLPQGAALVLGITSLTPKEGKSTFASNFAHHLAAGGYRTLLIDGDLRNPVLSVAFGARRSRGLLQVLSGLATLEDVVISDPTTKLCFVPSGVQKPIINSEELLHSHFCKDFISSVSERFDFVVFDAPPLLPVVDVRVLAQHLSGLFIIAEWDRVTPNLIKWGLKQSPAITQRLVGCILNKVPRKEINAYEGYY
jgi:polysaccharide biosynthesis transport protein